MYAVHISEGVEGDVEGWISCDIPVRPGDFVSLFGYRNVSDVYDTLISYGIGPHWERSSVTLVLGEETGAFMASAFDEAGPIPFQPNEGVRTWVEYNHVDTLNRLEFKYRAMDIEEEENVGYDIDWDEVPAPPEVNFTERNIVILPSTGKRAASKDDLIQMALEYEEGRKLKQQQEEEEARAIEAENNFCPSNRYEESYDGDYDYEYYDDDEDEDDDDVYFDEDRDEGPGISGYTEQNLGAGVGDEENYFDSISRAETESNLEAYEDRQDDSDIIFDDDSNDGTAAVVVVVDITMTTMPLHHPKKALRSILISTLTWASRRKMTTMRLLDDNDGASKKRKQVERAILMFLTSRQLSNNKKKGGKDNTCIASAE
eukprot:jgi/Bigna1/72744/fgenesh1_pg.21_\